MNPTEYIECTRIGYYSIQASPSNKRRRTNEEVKTNLQSPSIFEKRSSFSELLTHRSFSYEPCHRNNDSETSFEKGEFIKQALLQIKRNNDYTPQRELEMIESPKREEGWRNASEDMLNSKGNDQFLCLTLPEKKGIFESALDEEEKNFIEYLNGTSSLMETD